MPKQNIKFDPNEIPDLLEKAQNGDLKSRDELLFRFQRLVATLVNVCITGRPNYWSSYQKTFLRMFASSTVPIQKVATMLKNDLSKYDKEELFGIGQYAVLLAIERSKSNLASTIVYCFKDLIFELIKDPSSRAVFQIDPTAHYENNVDDKLALDVFISTLNEEEWIIVNNILNMDGEVAVLTNVPSSLSLKFAAYLEEK